MKTTLSSSHSLWIALALAAVLGMSACGGSRASTPAAPLTATGTSAGAAAAPASGSPNPAPAQPAGVTGGFDLANPAAGLADLPGYRQTYSLRLEGIRDGKPYQETQTMERLVQGDEEAIRVSSETSTGQVASFDLVRVGGYQYIQTAGSPCQAQPSGELPAGLNPAGQLPGVQGLPQGEPGDQDGRPALRYTFDATALSNPDGVLQSADGELWLAADRELVLAYDLTAALRSPAFEGTRRYAYALHHLAEGEAVQLPEGCQPVPADVPILPGAAQPEYLPGFVRYQAPASRADAAAFYYAELTAQGWQALPGSGPEQAEFSGPVTVLAYAQAYPGGGRVLVLQLSESGGALQVIGQTVQTKAPVQPGEAAGPGAGEEAEPEPAPGAAATLPPDLPAYPNAVLINETEGQIVLQIAEPAETVRTFYLDAFAEQGWTVERQLEQNGVTTTMLRRGTELVILSVIDAGSVTQVAITAQAGE